MGIFQQPVKICSHQLPWYDVSDAFTWICSSIFPRFFLQTPRRLFLLQVPFDTYPLRWNINPQHSWPGRHPFLLFLPAHTLYRQA